MWACVQNSKMRFVSEERQNLNITFLCGRLSALLTFAFFLFPLTILVSNDELWM